MKHIQHGGIGHLIADGEAQHIELRHRVAALQGIQGDAGLEHLLPHIAPGGEYPLAPHAGHLVDDPVQDAHTDVGHPDLISIREAEGHAQVHFRFVLDDLIVFPAGVPCGFLHPWQDAFQSFIHSVSPDPAAGRSISVYCTLRHRI